MNESCGKERGKIWGVELSTRLATSDLFPGSTYDEQNVSIYK